MPGNRLNDRREISQTVANTGLYLFFGLLNSSGTMFDLTICDLRKVKD